MTKVKTMKSGNKKKTKVKIKEIHIKSSEKKDKASLSSMTRSSKAAILVIVGFLFGFIFSAYSGSSLGETLNIEPSPVEFIINNRQDSIQKNTGNHSPGSRSNQEKNPKEDVNVTVSSHHPPPGSAESFLTENLLRKIPKSEVGIAITRDMKRYVCNSYGPRLGNLMFLYATCYGVAYDYNFTLALNPGDFIYGPFEGIPKSKKAKSSMCSGRTRSFNQQKARYYNKFDIKPSDHNIRLNGYLQSWKYFANSFDDLRQQFTWKKPIRDRANEIISNLVRTKYPGVNSNSVTTVGIHIRRGDYVSERRPMADRPYIESAKKYFLDRYPKVLFIVATNPDKEALKWCTDNIINGTGTSVFSGKNDRFVDMALLSMTDHVIISSGTYGWWAGFLNKGTVVHYDWIPPNHYKFNREDYVLPYWVGIKATYINWKNSQFRTLAPPPTTSKGS